MTAIHPTDLPASDRPLASSVAWFALPGRVLLSIVFLFSGMGKLTNLSGMAQYVHMSTALLAFAGIVELVGGISLLLGIWSRIGALGLFIFLIPTTLMFHNFWAFTGQEHMMQQVNFLKNLAIMGGLLMVTAYGPGPLSVTGARRIV